MSSRDYTYPDLMVDIETLSSHPTAAIVSIGAQMFNLATGETGEEFYMNVKASSSEKAGLHFSGDTIEWWLKQDPAAIAALMTDQHSLKVVLEEYAKFYHLHGNPNMWGNGCGFDCNIIRHAYHALGYTTMPWRFSKDRDVRTLVNMAELVGFDKKSVVRQGVAHNALDDVKFQIEYCHRAWKYLTPTECV